MTPGSDMTKKYWDEAIETASPTAIEKLQSEGLQTQMPYVYANSAYFAAKFDSVGVKPGDIKHLDDLARLPFSEKTDVAKSQHDGTLFGPHQCAPLERIVRVQCTGGSTGRPLRFGLSQRDVDDYNDMGARALWSMGCRPGEIIFECLNYNLYGGGVSDHMTFERLGAATIPFGVGNSKRLLEMMIHIEQDVAMFVTPSYAVLLAEVARENGIDPVSVGVRKGYFGGEAGIGIPHYREKIEQAWGLRSSDLYGIGELGMHCGECEERRGVHFHPTEYVLAELIDPDTGEPLSFEEGAIGEFVYTSLRREACPLVRMRSHDLVQVFTEPCACGRTSFRFSILGRSDDMFIVKGVNVFPLGVQATLAKLQPQLTGEFQIVLDRAPPIDYAPRINAEVARDVPTAVHEQLIARARDAIRLELNFTADITLVEAGSIATETKTKRLHRAYQED